MGDLGKLWSGNITGTNTGKVFVEIEEKDGKLSGIARLNDDDLGISVFSVSGSYSEGSVRLKGTPTETAVGTVSGEVDLEATLTPEGRLSGTWASNIGTGGAIYLIPQHEKLSDKPDLDNQEFFTRSLHIGPVRLNINELRKLADLISQDFVTGQLLISHDTIAGDVTKYAESFFNEPHDEKTILKKVKFFIQEPDKFGIFKQVIVEFNSDQNNYVQVQGASQSWVAGKIEVLQTTLKKYEKQLLTSYKKWGLGLNQVIFLAMIVFAPEIQSTMNRAIFVGFVVVALGILYWFHTHFIPIASVRLQPRPLGIWQRYGPQIISGIIGLISTLAASFIFWLLTGTQ